MNRFPRSPHTGQMDVSYKYSLAIKFIKLNGLNAQLNALNGKRQWSISVPHTGKLSRNWVKNINPTNHVRHYLSTEVSTAGAALVKFEAFTVHITDSHEGDLDGRPYHLRVRHLITASYDLQRNVTNYHHSLGKSQYHTRKAKYFTTITAFNVFLSKETWKIT